ncbi:MAG: alpha/beta hydrolase-fold protein [Hyphomicrobiaceae bacterium]
MYRLVGGVLALLATCVSARAESVIVWDRLPSTTLQRPFPFHVYLPDGYGNGELRYPVLYLLHGAGGDETSWTKAGHIKDTADRLIASRAIPPAIIVMPGCRACWWVDGHLDKADTAFWRELVPAIQRRYRTILGRRGRLVAGLSAGGYGAVRFAMRYPNRIAAVAALSPAVYADLPPAISSARSQPPFRRADGSFDDAMWQANNYTAYADAYFRQHQRVPFYLVSGDNDAYGIAFETMTLFRRLYERQPKLTELRIIDGDHSWDIWTRAIEGAMRYMFRFADKPEPMLVAANAALVRRQDPATPPLPIEKSDNTVARSAPALGWNAPSWLRGP